MTTAQRARELRRAAVVADAEVRELNPKKASQRGPDEKVLRKGHADGRSTDTSAAGALDGEKSFGASDRELLRKSRQLNATALGGRSSDTPAGTDGEKRDDACWWTQRTVEEFDREYVEAYRQLEPVREEECWHTADERGFETCVSAGEREHFGAEPVLMTSELVH